MFDTAILIGRFEPVHHGHVALLQHALDHAPQVIVVMGSAWQARSPKNPFTWQEREAMLRGALPDAVQQRLKVLPVRDYYNESVWVQAVRRQVAGCVPPGARVALVGHFKDATSSYLDRFPGWALLALPRQGSTDATGIREAYLGAPPDGLEAALAPWRPQMPESTWAFLQSFAHAPDSRGAYVRLCTEWQALRTAREAWSQAPYPPVFVTVDAVLRCQDHVLLIRRGHPPGEGLLAVPGGFIEQRETLWQSCVRELREETHCAVPEAQLRAGLRDVKVFDHPDRSQRGRTITHAHYIDLGDMALPAVQADDDARDAQWVPLAALAGREAEFFEDHFHMLDHFLGLTPRP
ncbi:bifunctional nicotinamide-nucleotide adenylyltransferase/Nudix hydroxylase [Acidovorax lacteus]|uniref:Bifunctional nicotinamide-nucleotide adenylyltransferase/Nudix hydroxylase n=1 Tax=Acidovorax lacteus TaxID=1924988 RepID=A0ABP8L6H6_9BURK